MSGSRVLEGVGRYVVVAVGTKSFHGRIMMGTVVVWMLFQMTPNLTRLQVCGVTLRTRLYS